MTDKIIYIQTRGDYLAGILSATFEVHLGDFDIGDAEERAAIHAAARDFGAALCGDSCGTLISDECPDCHRVKVAGADGVEVCPNENCLSRMVESETND